MSTLLGVMTGASVLRSSPRYQCTMIQATAYVDTYKKLLLLQPTMCHIHWCHRTGSVRCIIQLPQQTGICVQVAPLYGLRRAVQCQKLAPGPTADPQDT